MRNYYRIPIMFYEAATFIRFVKENSAALGREKILGLYNDWWMLMEVQSRLTPASACCRGAV